MQALPLAEDLDAARVHVAALEAAAVAEAEAARLRSEADRPAQAAATAAARRTALRTIHVANVARLSALIEAVDAADHVVDAYQRAKVALKGRPASSWASSPPLKLPEADDACRACRVLAARRPAVVRALAAERAALAALDGP